MFATVHNTHLPQFTSLIPEPRALSIDALSQDWIDPLGLTAAQIATFVYSFDTHGLSPQTIKGYTSCLASVLNRMGKAAAVKDKATTDMINY